jgi:hypothetical protein
VPVPSPLWQVSQEIGVPAPFKAMCFECAPPTFGYAVEAPLGGFAWHEVQFVTSLGSVMWQEVQSGAPETGDVPVTAWQFPQSDVKDAVVACVCAVLSKNGTAWLACPGPPEWQVRAWPDAFVKLAEKQLGADGLGPAPAAATLWQMPHAAVRFPEVRWEIVTPLIVREPCQSVGCAFAAVWQVEHAVDALPPLKSIVPGVPWHPWQ